MTANGTDSETCRKVGMNVGDEEFSDCVFLEKSKECICMSQNLVDKALVEGNEMDGIATDESNFRKCPDGSNSGYAVSCIEAKPTESYLVTFAHNENNVFLS